MNLGNLSEIYVKLWVLLGRKVPTGNSTLEPHEYLGLNFLSVSPSAEGPDGHTQIQCGSAFYASALGDVSKADLEKILEEIGRALLTKTGDAEVSKSSFATLESVGITAANSQTSVDLLGVLQALDGPRELGFSIKSFAGGNPSLFNANKSSTAFRMEVSPNDVSQKTLLNKSVSTKRTWFDRVMMIENSGFNLAPAGARGPVFAKSLQLFGQHFDSAIGGLLLIRAKTKINDVKRCAKILCEESGLDPAILENQLKSFLKAAALGLTGSKGWDGKLGMHGGYLVLKSDMSLVYIGVQNDDEFKEYLFNNAYFDSPGYDRHQFGFIYDENDQLYFDLNLQLRFLEN